MILTIHPMHANFETIKSDGREQDQQTSLYENEYQTLHRQKEKEKNAKKNKSEKQNE